MFRALRNAALSSVLAFGAMMAGFGVAHAQEGPGVKNQGRDCQTVRTCNYARNGSYRGCLSSYTCRTCRTVAVRCNLAGRTRCHELVCTWGG